MKRLIPVSMVVALVSSCVIAQSPAKKEQHCSISQSGSPQYPNALKGSGIEGTVVIEAVISDKGCTESVRVVQKLNPQMDEIAKQTVNSWKFTPATKDGKRVSVMVRIPIVFKETAK